jgi:hypothetical protein
MDHSQARVRAKDLDIARSLLNRMRREQYIFLLGASWRLFEGVPHFSSSSPLTLCELGGTKIELNARTTKS